MARFIEELSKGLLLSEQIVERTLKYHNISIPKIRSFFRDPQAWKRRDEFYSMFRNENAADNWWERFMDNYFLDKYGLVLDKELPDD